MCGDFSLSIFSMATETFEEIGGNYYAKEMGHSI